MVLAGLSSNQIESKRLEYGRNEIDQGNAFVGLRILLRQFASPLVYVLFAAAAATIWLADYADALVILLAVVVNVSLGFFQEYRAERNLRALKNVLSPKVEVIRGGKRALIDSSDLVPGDIVVINNEHKIGADGVVLEEDGVYTIEAMITGESVPVEKKDYNGKIDLSALRYEWDKIESNCRVFMGTEVSVGVGKMLVVRTGKDTEIGKIAKGLTQVVDESSPLQKRIGKLARILTVFFILLTVVIFVGGIGTGRTLVEMLPAAIALAVASIPEGLMIGLTVVLSSGMKRVLKRGALIRKLTAAETLGSVDVVCVDKTGTITTGRMTVVEVTGDKDKLVQAAYLCNDERDPLELSMREWALGQMSATDKKSIGRFGRIDSEPFNHDLKYIAVLVGDGRRKEVLVSGAPEVILSMSKMGDSQKKKMLLEFGKFASEGRRLVGFAGVEAKVASKKLNRSELSSLNWLGVLVFEDPLRDGVKEAVEEMKGIGVAIKMITGDYKETALAIAKQAGIVGKGEAGNVLTGGEMNELAEDSLVERVKSSLVFARTTPNQKLTITKILKEAGMSVAMTGDGVNDAPALRSADIGLVVKGATEVAKETAEMVMLDDNFGTIVFAIEEGRRMFVTIKKVITYLLADAFLGVILIGVSMIMGWELPLTAVQILWINLVTDGFPSIALASGKSEERITKRISERQLIDRRLLLMILVVSLLPALAGLIIFRLNYADVETARNMVFVIIGMVSLGYVFSIDAFDKPIWTLKFSQMRWLVSSVVLGVGTLVAGLSWEPTRNLLGGGRALTLDQWLTVIAVGTACLVIIEVKRLMIFRIGRN